MNTTHIKEPIEQKEKQKAGQLLEAISLRDYFAAKAMAIVMVPLLAEIQKRSVSDADASKLKHVAAGACYGIADAMLKARSE